MFDIKSATQRILKGSIIPTVSGIKMYTPDGKANYAALWTRDFAYMVEYAGEMMENTEIEDALQYLMNGADKNGWIPDRVEADGTPRYTAGGSDFPALPNLDNGSFLVIAVDAYLNKLNPVAAQETFLKWKDKLISGITCLPIDQNGFIINETTPLHSPYGFTDTVAKSGILCFETLLLWKAQKILIKWLEKTNNSAENFKESTKRIESNFTKLLLDESGMLLAATKQCRQIDVWGSCFAISVGFPFTESEKSGIAKWLIENYSSVVQHGQIRHLPKDEYWEKTFISVGKGTYQNGAFWATPTVWFVDAIASTSKDLAVQTLKDALNYFENYGIFECVNGEYRNLDTYVASATNIYGACKKYGLGIDF